MQKYTGADKYSMYVLSLSILDDGAKNLNIEKICSYVNGKYYMNLEPHERYPYYVDDNTAKDIFINFLINRSFGIYYESHGTYVTIDITAYILYDEQIRKPVAIAAHTIQDGQCSDYPEVMWYA